MNQYVYEIDEKLSLLSYFIEELDREKRGLVKHRQQLKEDTLINGFFL